MYIILIIYIVYYNCIMYFISIITFIFLIFSHVYICFAFLSASINKWIINNCTRLQTFEQKCILLALYLRNFPSNFSVFLMLKREHGVVAFIVIMYFAVFNNKARHV